MCCRLAVDEDELPEMLREAIQKARHRASLDASSDSEDTGPWPTMRAVNAEILQLDTIVTQVHAPAHNAHVVIKRAHVMLRCHADWHGCGCCTPDDGFPHTANHLVTLRTQSCISKPNV